MRARSPKKRARYASIADACAEAIARDRTCQAKGILPGDCRGPLDPQHVIPKGVRPDLADDPENICALCRGHHDYAGDHPDEANPLGFHGFSWDDPADLAERRIAARSLRRP